MLPALDGSSSVTAHGWRAWWRPAAEDVRLVQLQQVLDQLGCLCQRPASQRQPDVSIGIWPKSVPQNRASQPCQALPAPDRCERTLASSRSALPFSSCACCSDKRAAVVGPGIVAEQTPAQQRLAHQSMCFSGKQDQSNFSICFAPAVPVTGRIKDCLFFF